MRVPRARLRGRGAARRELLLPDERARVGDEQRRLRTRRRLAGGGAGYHYLEITIPCGWPSSEPVHLDLFSPEMNRDAGALGGNEEPLGNYDSTQFEFTAPA